jgi:catechol 2,3-dioxygenase-like lactoylglutathione lyase family enzyme
VTRRAEVASEKRPSAAKGAAIMISHVSVVVTQLERSVIFYDAVLASLGFVRSWTARDAVGYGHPGGDNEFAIETTSLR